MTLYIKPMHTLAGTIFNRRRPSVGEDYREIDRIINKLKKCQTRHAVADVLEEEKNYVTQLFLFLLHKCSDIKHQKVADTDHPPNKHIWFRSRYYGWLLLQVYRYVDFTSILVDNINDKFLATIIINGPCRVNWYKTFGTGQTILDITNSKCTHPDVIDLVNNKFPSEMVSEAKTIQQQTRSSIAAGLCPVRRKPPPPPRPPHPDFFSYRPKTENQLEPPSYESIYPTAPSLAELETL